MISRMTKHEVYTVKLKICQGYSQIDAARAVGISASTVNRICLGDIHRDIPWPNPEVGEELLRERRVRDQVNRPQGELTRGVIEIPGPLGVEDAQDVIERALALQAGQEVEQTSPSVQPAQMSEADAVDQARAKAEQKADNKRTLNRLAAEAEEEMEREWLADFTKPYEYKGKKAEPNKTMWDVKFMSWKAVLKGAKENDVVKALEDNPDDIAKRAVGIVFFNVDKDKWADDLTLRVITGVIKQLKETSPDGK